MLEASYIIVRLHPYYKNLNKRIIKAPKLYFIDVGLASFLLGVENSKQLTTHYFRGSLFENMVIIELLKRRLNNAQLSNLYFFRDSNKNEVDCIVEGVDLKAIEIKSSKTFSNSFIDGLRIFEKNSGFKKENGFLIYGGEESFTFKDFNVLSWRDFSNEFLFFEMIFDMTIKITAKCLEVNFFEFFI